MPTQPSAFAQKLAAIAEQEFEDFHTSVETDANLTQRIKEYNDFLGFQFNGVGEAWSAVFVSFCVKKAGATASEFKFSKAHSEFVHQAIQNQLQGVGVFQGFPLDKRAVGVGDILQNNRGGTHHDFAFARDNASYSSHSNIVTARGTDAAGKFARVIGGNLSQSVRSAKVRLNEDGTVKQVNANTFICLVKNLK